MTAEAETTYRLFGTGILPLWAGAVLTAGAAAAAILLLRGELRRRRRPRAPAALYVTRTLVAVLLGLLVMQPVLFVRQERARPGLLTLIADRSRSMLRTDPYPDGMLLDIASALRMPEGIGREVSAGRARRELLALQPAVEQWHGQSRAIHDELAQGLPWGRAFEETIGNQARDAAKAAVRIRAVVEAAGRLEARLADQSRSRPASKPAGEAPAPDAKRLQPLYELADQLVLLRDRLSKSAGIALDEPRAGRLVRAQEDLLVAWRAAAAALAKLQQSCDARFLGTLGEPARERLRGLSKRSRFDLARSLARQVAKDPHLGARHRVRLAGFDDLGPENAPGQTDLFAAIDDVSMRSLEEVVSGMVLFSDGRQNLPERPDAMRRLAGRGVKFVAAGVGLGGELPDVAVVDYRLPGVILGGQDATLVAHLKTAVPDGTDIQVELSGKAGALARKRLKAAGPEAEVTSPSACPGRAAGRWRCRRRRPASIRRRTTTA